MPCSCSARPCSREIDALLQPAATVEVMRPSSKAGQATPCTVVEVPDHVSAFERRAQPIVIWRIFSGLGEIVAATRENWRKDRLRGDKGSP
jgi:hypothetical protein